MGILDRTADGVIRAAYGVGGVIRAAYGQLQHRLQHRSAPAPVNPSTVFSSPYFHIGDIQKNPTVQACINAYANPISILPLNLYKRNADGSRVKAVDHPLFTLLSSRPNLSESPTLFKGKMVRHIMRGNAYLYKNYSGPDLVSLHLLNPDAVRRDTRAWPKVAYVYNGVSYTDDQILHIPALITDDTGTGISPAELARAAVLLGIQLDEYSLSSFGNGLNTKMLLDIADMTKEAKNETEASAIAQTVSDYIRRNYFGAENAGKPLILWNGMKATELKNQSSNRDAELLESRKWQETETCKIFNVPPFIINGNYDVKYGNLESAMTVYMNFGLSPYLRHIEQRFDTLLSAIDRRTYYFEFDFNVLLRPDQKSRGEFYYKLFSMGAMSPDDIASKENMEADPSGAGKMRFVPANMMPQTLEVQEAYMAGAKLKAQEIGSGSAIGTTPPDPARATGDQAQ